MTILAKLWLFWVPRDTIAAAGKRVEVSNSELDVSWMQEDKFKRASACMERGPDTPHLPCIPSTLTPVISSPVNVRHGSASY